jgi:hypothetical protein
MMQKIDKLEGDAIEDGSSDMLFKWRFSSVGARETTRIVASQVTYSAPVSGFNY